MKLGTTAYWLVKRENGTYYGNVPYAHFVYDYVNADYWFATIELLYKLCRKTSISDTDKDVQIKAIIDAMIPKTSASTDSTEQTISVEAEKTVSDKVRECIDRLINFFSEFEFEPNFRFINTFAYACYNKLPSVHEYVHDYFELTDSPYTSSVDEKMKSPEFKDVCRELHNIEPTHRVNNRFKLYYGSQGTGKTTAAMKEANDNVMVCHSAMLPSDLLEDFKFENGQATFIPSALQIAMTEGKTIVLDEINLLPFESLRFLQSVLDGKSQFEYKGKTITIADGFKIIGTMNLKVNGATYALPEPLVDRAEELKKYKLTADMLVGAII